jgi:flagellar motor protein MotB
MALTATALAGDSRTKPPRTKIKLSGADPSFDFASRTGAPRDDAVWLITLTDLTLLLLCFFIVLHLAERRRNAAEPVVSPPAAEENAQADGAAIAGASNFVPDEELSEPVTIAFATGTADVSGEMAAVLDDVVAAMQSRPELRLEIIGHTDDRPIATREFPTNWELASARASGVARRLIERGIDPARLAVQSYAAFRPVLPNSDVDGRGANRRVELRLFVRKNER